VAADDSSRSRCRRRGEMRRAGEVLATREGLSGKWKGRGALGGGGKSVAAGRGSRGSMAMTMPLPNARLCSIYGLKASEAVTSILEMES
jgi:hypothetical protein